MFRRAAQALPLFLILVAVVAVPYSVAATPLQSLAQQEPVVTVIVNQMAIPKGMNESSSVSVCGGGELHALREQVKREVRAMNEQVKEEVQVMNEQVKEEVQAMNEQVKEEGQAMHEQLMTRMQAMEKVIAAEEELQVAHNTTSVRQPPDPAALRAKHNDSYVSSCTGHKVLYGGHGILEGRGFDIWQRDLALSTKSCSWDVVLPEGSRPLFTWSYFGLVKCRLCDCNSVTVTEHGVAVAGPFCQNPPAQSDMAVVGNRFRVSFVAQEYLTPDGFKLAYHAVVTNKEFN